jgi:hypothetical protein
MALCLDAYLLMRSWIEGSGAVQWFGHCVFVLVFFIASQGGKSCHLVDASLSGHP